MHAWDALQSNISRLSSDSPACGRSTCSEELEICILEVVRNHDQCSNEVIHLLTSTMSTIIFFYESDTVSIHEFDFNLGTNLQDNIQDLSGYAHSNFFRPNHQMSCPLVKTVSKTQRKKEQHLYSPIHEILPSRHIPRLIR